jgi:hypothetical protein
LLLKGKSKWLVSVHYRRKPTFLYARAHRSHTYEHHGRSNAGSRQWILPTLSNDTASCLFRAWRIMCVNKVNGALRSQRQPRAWSLGSTENKACEFDLACSGREVTREQPHFDVQTHSHGRCWGAERGAHEEKVEKFRGDDSTSHALVRRWCLSLLGSRHDRWQMPAVLSNVMTGIYSRSSGRQKRSAP